MENHSSEYRNLLATAVHNPTAISVPFYSSVTGKLVTDCETLGHEYWVTNLLSRVRFSSAVSQILDEIDGPKVFLEIGPHSALAGPIRQVFQHHKTTKDEYYSVLTRGHDSHSDFLKAIGSLWLSNIPVQLAKSVSNSRFLSDLPTYPWHYEEPLWSESRLAKEWRFRKFAHHELLGTRIYESSDTSPAWRNVLRLESVPWLKDHEIAGDTLLPAAGFICMAGEAIRQLTGSSDFSANHVHLKSALVLQEGQDMEVITELQRVALTHMTDSKWYSFSISSHQAGSWIKHCFGQVCAGADKLHQPMNIQDLPRELSPRHWYRKMKETGLEYGPKFQLMTEMSADPIELKFVAHIKNQVSQEESPYAVHPSAMDCLLQSMAPASVNGLSRRYGVLRIPTYIEDVYVNPPSNPDLTLLACLDEQSQPASSADVVAISDGEVSIEMLGLKMSDIGDGKDDNRGDLHSAVELVWKQDINFLSLEEASSLLTEGSNGLTSILDLLTHLKADLRILEIGTANGTATAQILQALISENGERMYSSYTYADESPEFLAEARKRFENYQGLQFVQVDLSQDFIEEGVEMNSFDLIIACNVSHERSLSLKFLGKLHRLLHAQGRLVLQTESPDELGDKSAEANLETLKSVLCAVGLGRIDAFQSSEGHSATVLARLQPSTEIARRITVLSSSSECEGNHVKDLLAFLESCNYTVDLCTLDNFEMSAPARQDVMSTLDLNEPVFHEMGNAQFEKIKRFVAAASEKECGILWLTQSAQIVCKDPRYAMVNGFARVLRQEMGLDFATLELDQFDSKSFFKISQVLGDFQQRVADPVTDPRTEWAIIDGEVLTSRYSYIKIDEELKEKDAAADLTNLKLTQDHSGIDSLQWQQTRRDIDIAEGQVVVKMRAVGLNFKVGLSGRLTSEMGVSIMLTGTIGRDG